MTDFKEKLRKDASDILNTKEELNEAELKEFLGFNRSGVKLLQNRYGEKAQRDAEQRKHVVTTLRNNILAILEIILGIEENKNYFDSKKFNPSLAADFVSNIIDFGKAFDRLEKNVVSIIEEVKAQGEQYAPTRMATGKKK